VTWESDPFPIIVAETILRSIFRIFHGEYERPTLRHNLPRCRSHFCGRRAVNDSWVGRFVHLENYWTISECDNKRLQVDVEDKGEVRPQLARAKGLYNHLFTDRFSIPKIRSIYHVMTCRNRSKSPYGRFDKLFTTGLHRPCDKPHYLYVAFKRRIPLLGLLECKISVKKCLLIVHTFQINLSRISTTCLPRLVCPFAWPLALRTAVPSWKSDSLSWLRLVSIVSPIALI
jgi:hypothetical protein